MEYEEMKRRWYSGEHVIGEELYGLMFEYYCHCVDTQGIKKLVNNVNEFKNYMGMFLSIPVLINGMPVMQTIFSGVDKTFEYFDNLNKK